ncbi:UNVERIFIED_CONTAM: Pentatricopeptide repeat-containing protein [Sesamum calycinum]|uniref:Pentatricopeptide repeat-containing protein n=1 Tax=Sesamum calycinum TaxID=2727403 RepID=A0AAW2ISR0_9LAMI
MNLMKFEELGMTLKILKSLVGWDDFEGFLFGVLSFPKVGTQTANCLRILSSTKLASLIVGLSVTPPVKKSNDQIKQKKQKNQVLECLGHGHMSKKNGLERAPGGRVERKYSFSGRFGTQGGGINGGGQVLEKEDVTTDGFLEQLGWERALEIFEWFKMKRCYEVNVIHYNIMFKILGKARQWCEVERLWGEMWKRGIKPINSTYGDFKRAEEFFKKWSWSNSMVDERGRDIVWSEAHVSGDFSKCLRLLKECSRKNGKDKCSPDTRTYNILISVHAKHNDIDLAARYLTKMKEASLEPDAVSYVTLLYAFSIRHMVAEAEKLISEMAERGMEIDEFAQSSLTRMYIESGMLEKSWSWFQRFHLGGNMTSECYSANTDAFGERGYILEAQKVFECCQQVKKMTILEFNVMIKAYGISKKFQQACCLFDSMEEHGLIPDRCGYNSLVQMLATADLPQKATFYLRKMQEVGLVIDCVPYCAVISGYAKLGQMDMAVGLYKEMIVTA